MEQPALDPIVHHAQRASRNFLNGVYLRNNEWLTRLRKHLDEYSTARHQARFLQAFHHELSQQIAQHRPSCTEKANPSKCVQEQIYASATTFIEGELESLGVLSEESARAPAGPAASIPPILADLPTIDHERAMRVTLEEAAKATSENDRKSPKVAAAITLQGRLLGTAFRGQFGDGDHAEYTLFEKVLNGADVQGAVLYTTLEPCTSRNRHKPCSNWIIEKGIKEVHVGMLDPNPRIYNKGCTKLREAGIQVRYYPIDMRRELERMNASFIEQFRANPELRGMATFNPLNNDGLFTIGHGEYMFDMRFSQANRGVLHVYNDPPTIQSLAIAEDHSQFSEVIDASVFDTSSRSRRLQVNGIAILQNLHGYYAAVKLIAALDKSKGDTIDEATVEYRIQDDGSSSFAEM